MEPGHSKWIWDDLVRHFNDQLVPVGTISNSKLWLGTQGGPSGPGYQDWCRSTCSALSHLMEGLLWVGLSPPTRHRGGKSYQADNNVVRFVSRQSMPKMNITFLVSTLSLDFCKALHNTTKSVKSVFNDFSTGRSHKALCRGELLSKGGMFMEDSRRSKQGPTPSHIFISHWETNIEAQLMNGAGIP